jgi:hypothetical protein
MEQPLKNSLTIAETKELNLLERINAICEDLEPIRKDVKVKIGNGGYSAISHDNVTATISDLMCKYRIASIPNELEKNFSVETNNKTDNNGNTREVKNYTAFVTMQVQFVSLDDMNEQISVQMSAIAHDSGDKPFGKAQSMAVKYCFLKMFRMQTLSNEEARNNSDMRGKPLSEKQLKLLRANHDKLTQKEVDALKSGTMNPSDASSIIGQILNGKR